MAKAVFTTKVNPAYDDLPEVRYHFPRQYLKRVEAALGDWIVYYEPRRSTAAENSRGGRSKYFSTARVKSIEPDPHKEDHFYAFVEGYLDFPNPVPFRQGDFTYEAAVSAAGGKINAGVFQSAVRRISDEEFNLILAAGYTTAIGEPTSATRSELDMTGLEEEEREFERPVVEQIVKRPFRDAAFREVIRSAYDSTCAVTGLKIINGGGRAEVQAAHIKPVASGGSDSVRNGVALSSTVHWMFDRGLISFDDDYSILVAKDRLPDAAVRLIREERKLILPQRTDALPNRSHLRFHRENIFKG